MGQSGTSGTYQGKKGVWSARSVGKDLLDLKMGISEEKNTATLMQIYTF
jgi:hypothetical protein